MQARAQEAIFFDVLFPFMHHPQSLDKYKLIKIFLYDEPSSKNLDLKELKDYLKGKLQKIDISIRKDFISYFLRDKELERFAKELARARVKDLTNPNCEVEPFYGETQYEKICLKIRRRKQAFYTMATSSLNCLEI